MITYTTGILPGLRIPVLHRVVYGVKNITDTRDYREIQYQAREWCEQNCQAPFYTGPGYSKYLSVQFEDDVDALMFSLRFGNAADD